MADRQVALCIPSEISEVNHRQPECQMRLRLRLICFFLVTARSKPAPNSRSKRGVMTHDHETAPHKVKGLTLSI